MKNTVQLQAGLGNQMFGYTFSKYLEYKTKEKAKLSLLPFLLRQDHNGLEIHKVFVGVKGINICKYYLITCLHKIFFLDNIRFFIFRLIRNIKYPQSVCYWTQSPYTFIEVPLSGIKYYCGLWQNAQYAQPVREQLLSDFTFKLPKDGAYKKYEEVLLTSQDTVAIHIRRGDYLSEEYSNWNIFQDYSFFFNSIEFLKKQYNAKSFFIFSDDLIACKEIFIGDEYTFVEANTGKNSYLDMYLMTLATHNIISNSSFSWWAAFLKQKSGVVIAPKYWTSKTKIETASFSPNNWIYM